MSKKPAKPTGAAVAAQAVLAVAESRRQGRRWGR